MVLTCKMDRKSSGKRSEIVRNRLETEWNRSEIDQNRWEINRKSTRIDGNSTGNRPGIDREPIGNRWGIDRKSPRGGGPLFVSVGCQAKRLPEVWDHFLCPQGARRNAHPRWGGPLFVSLGCQTKSPPEVRDHLIRRLSIAYPPLIHLLSVKLWVNLSFHD